MFTPHGTFSPVQLITLIAILPLIGFWAWMLRDMMNNDDLSPGEQQNWVLAFNLLNVFGAAIYYGAVYKNRIRR